MKPIIALICIASVAAAQDAPWPTLHQDDAHSAYAADVVKGPYERKWCADFHDEMIATRVEAILAGQMVFVPTLAGRVHALSVMDGVTKWTYDAGAAVGHSPLYHNGRIYFGDDAGRVHCVEAAGGTKVWTYAAGAGVWVHPATDGEALYFGDRAGVFHAVDLKSGAKRWTYSTGGMILTSASVVEGRIVFAAEDMHAYCLDAEGNLVWKSAKLGGLSVRDHAPTIWRGLAIFTTNPAIGYHHAPGESPAILTRAQKALAMEGGDKIIQDKWGQYTMKWTARRQKAEHEAVLAHLRENRAHQTFYAIDLASGKEPWLAPVLYTAGLHNPATPPTFNPATNELYLWTPSALSNYSAGVPGGAISVAKLDRETGLTQLIYHNNGDKLGWAFDFVAPADETQALSLMGGVLLNTHQGIIGGMRLDDLKWHRVYIARDTYGGIFGPASVQGSFKGADAAHAQGKLALMCNEWHGPARGVVSIGYERLFWVAGSQVVCIGGPGTPRGESGGTKPPATITRKHKPVTPAGNVASFSVGSFDESVAKPAITAEQLAKFLAPPQRGARNDAALDALVEEVISQPWSPLIVELGISGEDRYFWRTAQTMQILAQAVPHVDKSREKLVAHLHAMFDQGMPLTKAVHAVTNERREPYDLGPSMLEFAKQEVRYTANIEDVYALWAYAHCADAWEHVLPKLAQIEKLVADEIASPLKFSHEDRENDLAEHLNARIAGLIGAQRLLSKAGKDDARVMSRLVEYVNLRVHHELADTRFVRGTKTARYKLHQAKIPRYLEMTPEVAAILAEFADEALRRNVADLSRDLPLWHHAWGERMIGGENYISPPHLARGMFAAMAVGASREELLRRLDRPWGKADLYYIEKLCAVLRNMK